MSSSPDSPDFAVDRAVAEALEALRPKPAEVYQTSGVNLFAQPDSLRRDFEDNQVRQLWSQAKEGLIALRDSALQVRRGKRKFDSANAKETDQLDKKPALTIETVSSPSTSPSSPASPRSSTEAMNIALSCAPITPRPATAVPPDSADSPASTGSASSHKENPRIRHKRGRSELTKKSVASSAELPSAGKLKKAKPADSSGYPVLHKPIIPAAVQPTVVASAGMKHSR